MVGVTLFDALHYANKRSEADGLETCYRLSACEEPTVGYGRVCDSATFEGPGCRGYRLPSEWEWELAANGGESACIWNEAVDPCVGCLDADFSCSAYSARFPDIQAWYCANSTVSYAGCTSHGERLECVGPHAVAMLAPNGFGLYDMHGNVAEFTGTAYDYLVTWRSERGEARARQSASAPGGAAEACPEARRTTRRGRKPRNVRPREP